MKTLIRVLFVSIIITLSVSTFAADKEQKKVPPARAEMLVEPAFTVNRSRTAVLIMDYQNDIVGSMPEEIRGPLLDHAASIVKAARKAGIPVIYVVVRFRDGYPEINPRNRLFLALKESGRLREGTPGADIDPRVAPLPSEVIVTKRRVGAFSDTDLETILRASNISTLVLCGLTTSGVVLSTVRRAADMDYAMVVVSDACADRDAEVHRVLMDKVFPWQAAVVSSGELLAAIGAKDRK